MEGKYNTKSPAVRRLMKEALELREATDQYCARPLEDNLFEWHFTVEGPSETEFEGGLYHGRILLPPDYPMKPPNIILLTPNGRFETNKKICLTISSHHPETWQPSWSIRTALLALIAFMPTPGNGTIGSLEYTADERKLLAQKSKCWECQNCGKLSEQLNKAGSANITSDESDLIKSVVFKGEEPPAEIGEIGDKKEVGFENREVVNDVHQITSVYEGDQQPLMDSGEQQIQETSTSLSNDVPSQCYKDSLFNIVIGIIVAAIAFLIYRRIFLIP